jgi:UDPglucose 6-dehydrogenase
MTISVVGLGKLGACMAAAIASRGFHVIGADLRGEAVAALAEGRPPVDEPGLADVIAAHRERLRATIDVTEAVQNSDLTFIVVPTPTDSSGGFSIEQARHACATIGGALLSKDHPHHIVLSSTVLPGACRHGLIPELERSSGRRCGEGFFFSYNPEFIALGSVVRDFLHPDFVLIGETDPASGGKLEDFYHQILPRPTAIRRMSLENAELAKIALNAYVTTKIAFANMLADFCERIPGGDVRAVCDALGADSRIGRRYLNGGPSFGGPCFPRDNRALATFAAQIGFSAPLPSATDRSNVELHERLASRILARAPSGGDIAVLGLSYKPDTAVVEASAGLELCRRLADAGRRVSAFDPRAGGTARAALPESVSIVPTAQAAIRNASVVIVATQDIVFQQLTPADWRTATDGVIVFDLWDALPGWLQTIPRLQWLKRGHGFSTEGTAEKWGQIWGHTTG